MSNFLLETFEHILHRIYLHYHHTERPFPLDGSEWARLVNERLERERHCQCPSCVNFLTRLHSKGSPLMKERAGVQCAMHHWFLQGQATYTKCPDRLEEFAVETDTLNTNFEQGVLQDAEHRWMKSNEQFSQQSLVVGLKSTQTLAKKGSGLSQDEKKRTDDEFWTADSSEFFESRQQVRRGQSGVKYSLRGKFEPGDETSTED